MLRNSSHHGQGKLQYYAVAVLLSMTVSATNAQHQATIHNEFQDPSSPTSYYETESCTWEEGQKVNPSGVPFDRTTGVNNFHPQRPYYSTVFNSLHKFSKWDQDATKWLFKNELDLTYADEVAYAYLNLTHSAFLRVTHEDEAGIFDPNHPPTIVFMNPWNIEATGQYTFDQNPGPVTLDYSNGDWDLNDDKKSIFTGVFRNPNIQGIPYYSVRVPNWYEDNGYAVVSSSPPNLWPGCWSFIRWVHTHGYDGNDPDYQVPYWTTRAIEFLADNDYSTAWYKAHLFSNVTGDQHATSVNSQRKVDVDDDGIYHAAYESSGQIWYTQSTDGGNVWSPEELVSGAGVLNCREPSIAEFQKHVYVAYVSGDNEIEVSQRTVDGWNAIINEPLHATGHHYPVVEANNACVTRDSAAVCVVWTDNDGGEFWLKYAVYAADRAGTLSGILVSSYNGAPEYPSIATTPGSESFHVAYKMAGRLYHAIVVPKHCNEQWFVLTEVSYVPISARNESVQGAPSLTIDAQGRLVVAYEGPSNFGGGGGGGNMQMLSWNPQSSLTPVSRLVVRQYSAASYPGSWNTTPECYLQGGEMGRMKPSIGAQPSSSCTSARTPVGIRVIFNGIEDPPHMRVWRFLRSSDCRPELFMIEIGRDPNIVARVETADRLRAIFCHPDTTPPGFGNHSLPYGNLQHELRATDSWLWKTLTGDPIDIREASVWKDSASATYTLRKLRVIDGNGDSTMVGWDCAHDTLVIGTNTTMDEKMRSAIFAVPQDGRFVYGTESFARYPGDFPQNAAFEVRFRDADSSNVLLTKVISIGSLPTDSTSFDDLAVDIGALEGRDVYITLGVTSNIDTLLSQVGSVYIEEQAIPKGVSNQARTTPSDIELEQNYPNPFNPSTEISFRISDKGRLLLSVLDLFGRVVERLIDQEKPAGRYTVPFDGKNLPSGIYFYRLTVGASSLTRKMCLVK